MKNDLYTRLLMATDDTKLSALKKALGKRIKEIRKSRKLTQKELAQQLGIPFSVLNKYESGINVPPIDKLLSIADALNASVDFLLTGNQSESSPLSDNRLIDRLQVLQSFSPTEQETMFSVLDAMILKHEVEGRIASYSH